MMYASSRKIIFVSISTMLLIISIIYYSFYTGCDMAEPNSPLANAAMEIKLEATAAHL
ncbi:MAG: hypothetical protein V7784_17890 [Oceanospirillaceae bacterium]